MSDIVSDIPYLSVRQPFMPDQQARVRVCRRCGTIVYDRNQHTRWHSAVDTATTTELPGER